MFCDGSPLCFWGLSNAPKIQARNLMILPITSWCFWCLCRVASTSCQRSWLAALRPLRSAKMLVWWDFIVPILLRTASILVIVFKFALDNSDANKQSSAWECNTSPRSFLRVLVTRYSRSGWSRRKNGCSKFKNSVPGLVLRAPCCGCGFLWKPYIFNWRMKELILSCLNQKGRISRANRSESRTVHGIVERGSRMLLTKIPTKECVTIVRPPYEIVGIGVINDPMG